MQNTPENSLKEVSWSEVSTLFDTDMDLKSWASTLESSLLYYKRLPPTTHLSFGKYRVTATEMVDTCTKLALAARAQNPQALKALMEEEYQLFKSVGNASEDVLVTAYYEPLLKGSLTKTEVYNFPLYRRPSDLLEADLGAWFEDLKGKRLVARLEKGRLTPYYDRTAIDYQQKLANKNLELVWVDSEIDAFFLQIQGSGRILMENGETMGVGYHGANGHPYRPIGTLLGNEGAIPKEDISLQTLKEWLINHPDEVQRVLTYNQSFVFFKKLEGGPVGNIAVPLTPGRSVATDHRLFPKGAPAILKTTLPVFAPDGQSVTQWRPDQRFVVNQDTGGAIRGPGRVDLFMGFGRDAENSAGVMKSENSSLYFIAPKAQGK